MTTWRNKGIRKSKRRAIVIRVRRKKARRKLATPILFRINRETEGSFKPTKRPVRLMKWLHLLMNADRVDARSKQFKHWRDKHDRDTNKIRTKTTSSNSD